MSQKVLEFALLSKRVFSRQSRSWEVESTLLWHWSLPSGWSHQVRIMTYIEGMCSLSAQISRPVRDYLTLDATWWINENWQSKSENEEHQDKEEIKGARMEPGEQLMITKLACPVPQRHCLHHQCNVQAAVVVPTMFRCIKEGDHANEDRLHSSHCSEACM